MPVDTACSGCGLGIRTDWLFCPSCGLVPPPTPCDTKALVKSWEQGATPSVAEFLPVYEANDLVWWRLGGGHHMNLFDELVELVEEISSWVDWANTWPEGRYQQRRDFALANIGALARAAIAGGSDAE